MAKPMEHVVSNYGPRAIIVTRWGDGAVIEVPPGQSYCGHLKSIWHGDGAANYTIKPQPKDARLIDE